MDALTQTTLTATDTTPADTPAALKPQGPMSHAEFNARVFELTLRYSYTVALKMARRERKARHPLHKRAIARRTEAADTAIKATGEFHPL